MSDSLFDPSREAVHRTDVRVTVVHRFAVGQTIVDVAGGLWKVLEVGYAIGPWYRIEALNEIASTSVFGDAGHEGGIRREAVRTVDRHFNPA